MTAQKKKASKKRLCRLCSASIEFLEIETLDAIMRPAWFSRITNDRTPCLTTMCGLGYSEAIPPTQFHTP